MTIKEMWVAQENDQKFISGIMLRGFGGEFLPDVFIALKSPGKFRCLAASVSEQLNVDLTPYTGLNDLEISLESHPRETGRKLLLFKLINPIHTDIFAVLCEDLISSVGRISNEHTLVASLLNRFENWNGLFKKTPGDWLSQESQRGMYGELYFLRQFLQSGSDWFFKINSWVGCENQVRDFQSGNWAVEVKTTRGNNHQKVHINGDRQLDISHITCVYLYHISLEVLQHSGETLPELISDLRTMLASDVAALNRFNTKLLFGGYFDEDSSHYEETGYEIRNDTFYKVEGDFPRIEEDELRAGIGDVSYTIIISACQDYTINSDLVLRSLNLNE